MSVSIQFCEYDCPINLRYQIPARTDPQMRPEYMCARCGHSTPVTLEPYWEEFRECGRGFNVCPECYPQWCVVRTSWLKPKPENPDGMVGQIIWE